MKITIVSVGKIKESYYRGAIEEYSKRLSKYCKLEIIEVADEKTKENASLAEENLVKEKEGERILKNLKEDAYVIALSITGKKLDSVAFSKKLDNLSFQEKVIFSLLLAVLLDCMGMY